MKDLKTYITEAIKPPRLSAKNKELWAPNPLDKEEVMEWLTKNSWVAGKVEIDDNKINVRGGVSIHSNIDELPYPFGRVDGNFIIESPRLNSLRNCPIEVGGDFNCSYCGSIESLEGAPEIVEGSFKCEFCHKLTSIEGAPYKVGCCFDCDHCRSLKSLEGAPKEIGKNFYCHACGKKFTEEEVAKICAVGGDIFI